MNPSLLSLVNKTYIVLKDCLLDGLDTGSLTVEDSEQSSYVIERNMQQITSSGELLLFTQDLARQYPAYQKAYIYVKQQSTEQKDKQKLDALQQKLRSFTSSTPPLHAS